MELKVLEKLADKISNGALLIALIITLFVIPIMPKVETRQIVFSSMFTIIFFMGVLTMEKYRKPIFWIAITALITEWISHAYDLRILVLLSEITNLVFFLVIVASFIMQIARTKKVDAKVIIESINGYLLLGLAYSILVAIVMVNIENAYKFPEAIDLADRSSAYLHEYIYYTFVTLTTLGYGDIIPLQPISKSLALLISISGQIYVAILIAMLVGKYASNPE
jgi:voltage-gated potassium channel Kch